MLPSATTEQNQTEKPSVVYKIIDLDRLCRPADAPVTTSGTNIEILPTVPDPPRPRYAVVDVRAISEIVQTIDDEGNTVDEWRSKITVTLIDQETQQTVTGYEYRSYTRSVFLGFMPDTEDFVTTQDGIIPVNGSTLDPNDSVGGNTERFRVEVKFGGKVTDIRFIVKTLPYGNVDAPKDRVNPQLVRIPNP